MTAFIKVLLKKAQQQYIDLFYEIRKIIKWKKINNVYLNITDQQITKKIFGNIVRGDYEIDENKILKESFSQNDILLELGTGLGFNSIYCAKINNNKVLTFEGNPNLIPLIKKNMRKNNTEFDLRNEILISKNHSNTSATFNIVEDFWSSSAKDTVSSKIIGKVTVPTRDVNEIIKTFQPTYLLVDIEGGEDDLFDNCDFLQNSSIKKILLELHADVIGEEKCFTVMKNLNEAGYRMRLDGAPKNVAYFFKES